MAQTAFYDICIIITILKINNEKIGMAAYTVFPVSAALPCLSPDNIRHLTDYCVCWLVRGFTTSGNKSNGVNNGHCKEAPH